MIAGIKNMIAACSMGVLRQRLVTSGAAGTPVNLATATASSLVPASGFATVTFAAAHGLVAGDAIRISGVTGAMATALNTTFEVLDVPSSTTLRFACDANLVGAAPGTIVVKADLWFRGAKLVGNNAIRTANVGLVYVGPDAADGTQGLAIASGATVSLDVAPGARLNLADLWVDVVNANDGVLVIWH